MGNPVQGETRVVERHALDLTPMVVKHLDVHLAYTVMQHLVAVEPAPYEAGVLQETQLHLLKANAISANTVQTLQAKYKEIYGTEKPEWEEWGAKLQEKWGAEQQRCMIALNILGTEETLEQAKKCGSLEEAQKYFEGLTQEDFDRVPHFLRLLYDAYVYDVSRSWLTNYKALCKAWNQEVSMEKQIAMFWGQIGGCILASQWDLAADFVLKLDELVENAAQNEQLSKMEVMKQRTWLLHWMLFVVFIPRNNPNRPENSTYVARVLELFLSEKYFCLVSLRYPYMLRYVAGAYIITPKLRYIVKDIVHVLNEDRERWSDPVTEFVLAVCHDFDFEKAKSALEKCQEVCRLDYFLHGDKENFVDQARLLLFEAYSKMHGTLDLEKVQLGIENMEEWIVGLIRGGKMKARIEDRAGKKFLIRSEEESDVYNSVCNKTQEMSFRLFMLENNAKRLGGKTEDPTQYGAAIAKHLAER